MPSDCNAGLTSVEKGGKVELEKSKLWVAVLREFP